MQYSIIHELPGRLRIALKIPGGFSFNMEDIRGIKGVFSVSFSSKTRSLLIKHNGSGALRNEIVKAIENAPLGLFLKKSQGSDAAVKNRDKLAEKKKAVIGAGARLLLSPLLPLHLRIPLFFYGAFPFFKKGIASLIRKKIDVNVLNATAIAASMGMRDYKTAGMIALLLKTGEYLEERTRDRSRKMLTGAFYVEDGHVWIKEGGIEKAVKASSIREGNIVVVRAGSRIPVDGIVVEGEAMVNQSSITGEPLPVMKRQGATVYAATVVEEGSLFIEASNIGSGTKIAKIVKIIEESAHLKADIESHAEKLADRVVPYTFALSGLTYLFTGNAARAASVLLIDYSCAIKLSTPLSIMSGMLMAAKKGALIKGGKFIEKLSKTDVFVFDKTGTLTKANPSIIDVIPFNGYKRDFVLKHAACVEEHFPHPVATAVINKAKNEGLIHEEEHSEVEYIAAHGIASHLGGRRILVGSRHFIVEDEGIDDSCCREIITKASSGGHSILYVAIDDKLAGLIVIEDPLREEALGFIKRLKDSGISKILMITGDADASARNVSGRLGITEYYSQALPDKKTEIVKWLRNSGYVVAMVGDGINDSAALANADVGISMKHGADIAKEACDVLLLDGSLMSIIEAKKISERVMNIIRQNFKCIVGINSFLILLSLKGLSTPLFSAFMHNASTVLSALNSIRLGSDKDAPAMEKHGNVCRFGSQIQKKSFCGWKR
ncbi:heavy metal translocating P-type ATPase [Dissulfurispira sp.]|uniref:heavy metal translocating P-type ATPase n=1 Tax=Dissulfurispira sp. TaxID=2817609 RepID=UPI002FD8F610